MTGTIFALASGRGRAGVAVIRVSGPDAGAVLERLAGSRPQPRVASLRTLTGEAGAIDQALVLWFPSPNSFTGEDVAELHVHGGTAIVAAASAELMRLGVRPAGPGEFTRRAFDNGRMDLTEAEGLADLIDAETEGQRKLALKQMGGSLHHLYEGWRTELVEALALLEATIDFSDEEIPDGLFTSVNRKINGLSQAIRDHLNVSEAGSRVRDGVEVVISGPPNAGKSSFINMLARRDVAIVTDIPGTTRDLLEVHLDLGGYAVTLVDTAGLRETGDVVEAEGVRRARARAGSADLNIRMVAMGDEVPAVDPSAINLLNKIDLGGEVPDGWFGVSLKNGEGVEEMLAALTAHVGKLCDTGSSIVFTRARHREALEAALVSLMAAAGVEAADLKAEELRRATYALGRLTGRVDVEELLEVIFSSFCIGK